MASSSNVGGPVPVPSSNSTEGVDRVKLVFDIEEDVVAELQEFVRLSHSGLFLDAQALFDECLSPYDRWFPALAEYCDNLLRQGRYGDLRAVSADAITKFDDAHKSQLFTLMEVIAKVHQEGSVNDSFEQVWNIWRSIPIPDKGSDAKLGIKVGLRISIQPNQGIRSANVTCRIPQSLISLRSTCRSPCSYKTTRNSLPR